MLSSKTVFLALVLSSSSLALPLRREVPQEHSHQQFLTSVQASLIKNNPDQIQDSVFGLLGDAAAKTGAGKITDVACLQQATADQAFTNAKAAGDVKGQVDALIYRALERNTGSVGLASAPCTSIKAKNPEIAAIQQHQDPASNNAASINKAITLELAKQIAAVGGDPQQALLSGTFAPGKIGDPTAKGNSCDDQNDPVGCAISQKLIVNDATPQEIDAAVAGVAAGNDASASNDNAAASNNDASASDAASASNDAAATSVDSAAAAGSTSAANAGNSKKGKGKGKKQHKGKKGGKKGKKGKGAKGNKNAGGNNQNAGDAAAAGNDAAAAGNDAAAAGNDAAAAGNDAAAAASDNAAAGGAATNNDATTGGSATNIGNFGICSVPEIEFAAGFDNRKETSFQPKDKNSYNHGSAQNINIITQFICDTLTNKCKADATAKATCAAAQKAAAAAPPKEGIDADTFNSFFGISTNFRNVQAIDDQGKPIAGSTGGDVTVVATAPASQDTQAVGSNGDDNNAQATATAGAAPVEVTATSSSIGNFGKCTVPQIEFAVGFDGRKETSFQPVDKKSYNHGSAQNINIITQFICDTLTNSCGADATAKATCAAAQKAAAAAPPKEGIDADTFNSFFGIATNFRNVQAIDDQGNPIAGSTGGDVNVVATQAASGNDATATQAAGSSNNGSGNNNASGSSGASGANVQTFKGALGGISAPPVTQGGSKGFVVDGSEFINASAALGRSCDVQHNQCANKANSGGGFSVSDCDKQNNDCHAAISA